jgi:hypothetical protein
MLSGQCSHLRPPLISGTQTEGGWHALAGQVTASYWLDKSISQLDPVIYKQKLNNNNLTYTDI